MSAETTITADHMTEQEADELSDWYNEQAANDNLA